MRDLSSVMQSPSGVQKKAYDALRESAVEKLLGRQLPHNLEAERALLGALLLNDEHLMVVGEKIGAEDFYLGAHKTLYQVMSDLVQAGKRIDSIVLHDELQNRGLLEKVGGVAYLVSLQEHIPSLGLVEHYVTIVRQKSVLRALIISSSQIITQCYNHTEEEIDAVLDEAEKTIFAIAQQRSQQSFLQLTVWLKRTFQHLSEIRGNAKGITGIPGGYKRLDALTSGFQNGDLIILAARPSMGKTALALNFALNAIANGSSVGFFSLEMSAEQLALRLLSSESRVNHHAIRTATISSDEWMELTSVAARLANKPFFIDDMPLQTIMDIRTKARKLKSEKGLDFLIIDYLQLINTTRKFENRHQEVADISRSLKALAKELKIPILALSQLSRAVESRVDKRPMLSDLRESGAIEQDADLIMFLYRDIVYNAETDNPALAELIIGKQRNGSTGMVPLIFQRELTLFEDGD